MKLFYEEKQEKNLLTRVLHGTRYKNLRVFIEECMNRSNKRHLRLLDIGCATAKAFSTLDGLYDIDYVGIEMRQDFCDAAEQRYGGRRNFTIICDSIENHFDKFDEADVVISLETFEHMPGNLVLRVIEAISLSRAGFLYCTVPNELGLSIVIKNIGSVLIGHTRHREYTWKETFYCAIYDLNKVRPHENYHRGFDWRWLGQTIRYNMQVFRVTTSPFGFVPTFISPSIGFMCSKRGREESPNFGR